MPTPDIEALEAALSAIGFERLDTGEEYILTPQPLAGRLLVELNDRGWFLVRGAEVEQHYGIGIHRWEHSDEDSVNGSVVYDPEGNTWTG